MEPSFTSGAPQTCWGVSHRWGAALVFPWGSGGRQPWTGTLPTAPTTG